MLYISIIVIFSGIVVLVYSVVSDNRDGSNFSVKESYNPDHSKKRDWNSGELSHPDKVDLSEQNRYSNYRDETRFKTSADPFGDEILEDEPIEPSLMVRANENGDVIETPDLLSSKDEETIIFDDESPEFDFIEDDLSENDFIEETRESDDEIFDVEEDFEFGEKSVDDELENIENEDVIIHKESDNGIIEATLFNDNSNIVDYSLKRCSIDSTFEEYDKIKRVGKGSVELDRDGISFLFNERLYRYDFYKIDEIVDGENYLTLFLRGDDSAKLFILGDNSGKFIPDVIDQYNDFSGK